MGTDTAVEHLRRRLLAESFPRLQMSLIVALAGLCAFLCPAALLAVGLSSLAGRYFLAAVVGYFAFLLLIRAWISFQRRRWDLDLDLDLPPRGATHGGSGDEPFVPGGGSFGGGGAGRSFDAPAPAHAASPPPIEAPPSVSGSAVVPSDWVPDLDEGWPLPVVLGALAAGFAALGFVVYASPILFAEVLLDAAVAGAVYRRVRRRSRAHWLQGVVRRTWLPAVALCVFVAVAGFAVQSAVPGARSLGDVIRAAR